MLVWLLLTPVSCGILSSGVLWALCLRVVFSFMCGPKEGGLRRKALPLGSRVGGGAAPTIADGLAIGLDLTRPSGPHVVKSPVG